MRAELVLSRVCRVRGAHRPAPTLFHYPGLSARPWYERTEATFCDWVPQLEAATPAITQEYLRIRESGRPSDYESESSDHDNGLHAGGQEWHWASLIDRGHQVPEMWDKCPVTATALTAIPGLCVGSMPFAFAFFSTLRGGCRIAPHTSPCNLRIRVHLPLLVPEPASCGMRVAGETRHWEPGKALIFDDSFEHEVWNDGGDDRVVLLFDLWHQDLLGEEKSAIQKMFGKVEELRDNRVGQS